MTIGAALYNFFSGFQIPAYPVTSVPEGAEMPYLTYDTIISDFDDGETVLNVNLYYRTESEATPTSKAMEIGKAIKENGILTVDDGYIWLKWGSPFCKTVKDEDNSVKRRYMNVAAEYFIR